MPLTSDIDNNLADAIRLNRKEHNMPCDCSHYEPRQDEIEAKEAAEILVFLYEKRGVPISKQLKEAADNIYGGGYQYRQVPELCSYLGKITNAEIKKLVMDNFEHPASSKLMGWWRRHQEADRKRRAAERRKIRKMEKEQRAQLEKEKHASAVRSAMDAYGIKNVKIEVPMAPTSLGTKIPDKFFEEMTN